MEKIDEYLTRSLIKDDAKGGQGWRSLQEVANACATESPKMTSAAELLVLAEMDDIVECSADGPEMFWRTTRSLTECQAMHPSYIP